MKNVLSVVMSMGFDATSARLVFTINEAKSHDDTARVKLQVVYFRF